jgi:hypothetical protein
MSKPYKTLLCIDYETRWDSKEYTLSSMTTEEYIRDPRFKAFGVCIHEYGTDKKTMWYGHDELPRIFATYDWTTTAVLCQNSMFDCGILSFIYDVHPCFIFDTLSMARAVRGTAEGNSLAKMAEAYGLPPKGRAVHSTDGLQELTPAIEKELADYCVHDVFLCEEIFKRLVVNYPTKELRLISMTIKMFTEPKLVLDTQMLEIAEESELDNLKQALAKAGVDEAELASNAMFADILRSYGIDPPMKISKTTGKPALALAKNDAHFQQLLNGDNEEVALLCDARVNVKSTQARTRARRFLGIASRGALPIPLNYFATETGRYGGCFVADTKVLVYDRHNGQCEKRIVDVLPDDLVWDGVDFVQHEGVSFNGYKEVITYAGLTGTANHEVFTDAHTTCSLAEAARSRKKLMVAAKPDSGALERARAVLKRLGR